MVIVGCGRRIGRLFGRFWLMYGFSRHVCYLGICVGSSGYHHLVATRGRRNREPCSWKSDNLTTRKSEKLRNDTCQPAPSSLLHQSKRTRSFFCPVSFADETTLEHPHPVLFNSGNCLVLFPISITISK